MQNPTSQLDGIHGQIAVLERRKQHLERRLDQGNYQASMASDFDRAEVEALKTAIDLMVDAARAR